MKKYYIVYGNETEFVKHKTEDYLVLSVKIPYSVMLDGTIDMCVVFDSKGKFDHQQDVKMDENDFKNFAHLLSNEDAFIHNI